jgi:type I restriction enzyme M protein
MNEATLIQKVWNYATVLKNEGVHYGAYISEISFLLFLKMDDERSELIGEPSMLPKDCRWKAIKDLQGEALAEAYGKVLENSLGSVRYDVVLTNPPFGRKQGYKIVGDDGEIESEREEYNRPDFIKTTSNKQLNFLQHIMSVLKENGRATVVLPDNVLFEGGGAEIRKRLLDNYDFHTLLRLPTGIFYKQGVKANVLFFDRKPASETPWTKELWIYDFRTNKSFTLKERPLKRADLDDFVSCYAAADRQKRAERDRFRRFDYDALTKRDKINLDIFWLKDDSLDDPDLLPPPDEVAAAIVESLEAALDRFRKVAASLSGSERGVPE